MLGLSRLAYSLSTNRQIPSALGRLHPARSTPYVLIDLRGRDRRRARRLGGPRLPDRHLRVRRDARVHDRAPVDHPAALHRARARPPLPDPAVDPRPRRPAAAAGRRRRGCLGSRLDRGDGRARSRALRRAGLDGVRDRALRDLPPRRRNAAAASASRSRPQVLRAEPPQRTRLRLDPRAALRHGPRRRHRADRGAAGRQRADRRGGDRRGHDRGDLDLRDPDVAAARRAPPRRADQARPPGAGAGQGGGGGVHRRRGRDGDGAHPARRLRDRRGGAPARCRGDRARRRGTLADPRRRSPGRSRRAARGLRRGHHEVRRPQGRLPRDRDRPGGQGLGGRDRAPGLIGAVRPSSNLPRMEIVASRCSY